MKELNDEIKLTLNLIQSGINDGTLNVMQHHLTCLLEIKRNKLHQRLVECSLSEHVTSAQEPNDIGLTDLKKAFGCYSRPSATEEPYKSVDAETDTWCCYLSGIDLSGFVFAKNVKPLTEDELRAGGWWCSDVSDECRRSLIMNGMEPLSASWNDGRDFSSCCLHETLVVRINTTSSTCKQIHRIGDEFYWGE